MKNKDFSTPYATLGINKITAPKNASKDCPKGTKSATGKDMRGGKK